MISIFRLRDIPLAVRRHVDKLQPGALPRPFSRPGRFRGDAADCAGQKIDDADADLAGSARQDPQEGLLPQIVLGHVGTWRKMAHDGCQPAMIIVGQGIQRRPDCPPP